MFVGSKRTGGLARLGEILLEAGLIKPEIVTQSLAIAKNARLPIGRVLVMSGHLSDKVIENAIEVQSGIRSGKFTKEYAVKLMKVANSNNVNIEQASAIVAWDRTQSTGFGELGKFLLAAEMVEEERLWAAHTRSKQEGTSLGLQLVKDEIFSARSLLDVLQVVVFSRQELLTRAEAVLIVQKLHKEQLALPDACAALGFDSLLYPPRIRLAELLVNANLLDETAALDAVETSLEQRRMVGEILIERNQLDLSILEAALNLQEMVHSELLLANYVGEVLELVKCLERPLDAVLSDLEEMNATAQFINAAGLLSDDDKSLLYEQYEVNRLNIGKVLFASGLLSDEAIKLACTCLRLIEAGIVMSLARSMPLITVSNIRCHRKRHSCIWQYLCHCTRLPRQSRQNGSERRKARMQLNSCQSKFPIQRTKLRSIRSKRQKLRNKWWAYQSKSLNQRTKLRSCRSKCQNSLTSPQTFRIQCPKPKLNSW
jgi:hypothetical protein